MAEVERLLTSALVEFRIVDPAHRDAQSCLREYEGELERRFDGGFDAASSISAAEHELRSPAGLFLIGFLAAKPVACGALKFHGEEPAELKRMWVARSARGLGLARRLLSELEGCAVAAGSRVVRLETNKNLAEAIRLYRSSGYREVAPFNDELYAHHWFEKRLTNAARR